MLEASYHIKSRLMCLILSQFFVSFLIKVRGSMPLYIHEFYAASSTHVTEI